MSRDATIIEISSESDSDNECNANYPFDGISKIELIKDETDTIDDDDVQIVSITQLAPEPVAARTKPVAVNAPDHTVNLVDAEKYFAPKNGLLAPWRKCQIVSEISGTCNVRFCGENNVCAFRRYRIARTNAPKSQLASGTRVIAVQTTKENVKYFYAGVIGEQIRRSNNYHYMVFFDNGRVQYVHPSGVREMLENDRWLHVHENARRFMRYCFEASEMNDVPMKVPIILESLGDRVQVECDGKWQFAIIVNTRGESLLQIEYEGTKRTEWLYRGSPRLSPIWRKYMKVQEVNFDISLIETYSSPDDDNANDSDNDGHEEPSTSAKQVQLPKNKSMNRYKRLKAEKQKAYRAPLEYTRHDCNANCCTFDATTSNLKKYGPLALPMIMGWTRAVNKRIVWYTTPCGKVMRNMHDLRRYLQVTKCKLLDVDNFCYEHEIDCMRGYETNERHILSKDLSNGVEAKPILVTNEFSEKMPDKFTYVTKMCLNRNVPDYAKDHIESMSCCDCADDCYERFDCPCWQLTLAGLSFTNTPLDQFGYHYKRLNSVVATAIYECNVNCKCSKKCSNRVAQVSIAHNLELFRTRSCGWGVRCRNDLPSGAFVCCYFGDLMTEEHTEHMAKKHGDTYLAQLNFIESAEEYKEGYESHAHMSPSSLCIQSESDSDKAGERPPAKKARTSQVQSANETSSEVSSAGSSTSPNAQEMNEPPVTVINYFPRMETTNESHPTRQLFGRKETEYIIDGKRCGNIGRFFNHSCDPNMFLQNVFIDTHDLRFPRLALFTSQPVTAGTELKWDYNYIVDSVPNREIKCECGAKHCRGRLL